MLFLALPFLWLELVMLLSTCGLDFRQQKALIYYQILSFKYSSSALMGFWGFGVLGFVDFFAFMTQNR